MENHNTFTEAELEHIEHCPLTFLRCTRCAHYATRLAHLAEEVAPKVEAQEPQYLLATREYNEAHGFGAGWSAGNKVFHPEWGGLIG
jgi:hypothetical protein